MRHSRNSWIRIALLTLVLVTAAMVRATLAPFPGHQFDIGLFLVWADMLREHGLTAIYDVTVAPYGLWVNYPPVFLYILSGLAQIFPMLGVALVKLPAIVVDLVLGVVVWYALRAKSLTRQLVATTAVLLNPAVFLVSSFWGQVDNLYTLFSAFAIWAAVRKQWASAGVLAALAVCTKPQAIVIAPVLIALFFLSRDRRTVFRCTGAAVLTMLVIFAPFLAAGKFIAFARPFLGAVKQYAYLTMNAMNVWWPVARGQLVSDDMRFFGVSAFAIGIGLVMVSWAWAGWWAMRRNSFSDTMFAAAFCALAFFFFATEMHERYVFPVFIFLPLALGAYWRSGLVLVGMLTIPFIANVAYVLAGTDQFFLFDWWWLWYATALLIMFVTMLRRYYAKASPYPAGVQ